MEKSDSIRLSKPLQAAGIYAFLGLLPNLISVITLPIYLKHLSVSDYGELSIILFFGNLVGVVAILQLNAGASITFFNYNDNQKKLQQFKATIFTLTIVLCSLSALLFLLAGMLFFNHFLESPSVSFSREGLLVIGSTLFNQIQIAYAVFLKNEYNLKQYLLITLSFLFMNVIFQYYCIVFAGLGVAGSLLGSFMANLIVTLFILSRNRQLIRWKVEKEIVKGTLRISLPLIPAVFLEWYFIAGSRIFVEIYMTIEDVAKIALLATFMLVTNKLFNSFWNGFLPRILLLLKRKTEADRFKIDRIFSFHIKVGIVIISATLMIGLNLSIFPVRQDYLTIVNLFPMASLALLPKLVNSIPSLLLLKATKSHYAMYSMALSTLLLILFFVILIPNFGLAGVLVSFCLANLMDLFLRLHWCSKFVPNTFIKISHTLWIILASGFIGVTTLLCNNSDLSSGFWGLVQFFVLGILVAWSYKDELMGFLMKMKIY